MLKGCVAFVNCGLMATLTLGAAPGLAMGPPTVTVSTVEELYGAINDPPGPNLIVILAAGNYVLTTEDANGQSRPNGGRLVLQPGMALIGENEYVDADGDRIWDARDDDADHAPDTDPVRGLVFAAPATETIIDARNLVSGGQGAVRAGRDNRIERLTVRNTNGVAAAIDVNVLPSTGGMHVEIRDCLLEDGQRGIRLQHSQLNGVDSSAVLERNVARRQLGTPFGFGAQIQNGGSTASSWNVIVRNSRFYGNRFGLFAAGNGSRGVESRILSVQNLYEQNQTGVNLFSGLDSSNVGSHDNRIDFTSVDDGIFDNREVDNLGRLGAGVLAAAGVRSVASATPSSGNQLALQFIRTRWGGNFQGTSRRDLVVYGAVALASSPGIDNTARVLLRRSVGDGGAGAFQFIDSQPVDPTNTDRVTILGSSAAFEHSNVGIGPWPDWYFGPEDD